MKNYVQKLNIENENINAEILFDASNPLKQRIELLSKNGMIEVRQKETFGNIFIRAKKLIIKKRLLQF